MVPGRGGGRGRGACQDSAGSLSQTHWQREHTWVAAGGGGRVGGFGFLFLERSRKLTALCRRGGSQSVGWKDKVLTETEERQHFRLPGVGGSEWGWGR